MRTEFFSSLRRAVAVCAPLLLIACGQQQPHGGGMGGFPPPDVTAIGVQPAPFPVAFEYVGQVAGSKDAEVRARVTGIVERRMYQEGTAVRAGQPLFRLDPKPFEAQLAAAEAELARAQAQKAWNDREAARLKPLAERKAIGQKEADDAVSTAELAAAAVKAAQANVTTARLNLSYTRVVAPIGGLAGRAQQSEGSLANANTTLLTTISQVDPIWVVFNIAENERLRLTRAAAQGRLTLPSDDAYEVAIRLSDGSTFPRTGRINFSDPRINPQTGTYELRAELANKDGALRPGQFVRVVLKGAQRKDAIAVPQVAVLEGPQGKFVYVVGSKDGKDVALPKPVALGDWVEAEGRNLWVVESGLAPGDRVIVDGVARIMMPGMPVKITAPGAATAPAGSPQAPAPKDASPAPKAPAGAK